MITDFNQWLGLQNPWWLLLILPLMLGWWFSREPYYFRKSFAYLTPISLAIRVRIHAEKFRFDVPKALRLIVMFLFIAALADITRTYEFVEGKAGVHRIFLVFDSSSSTYGFSQNRFRSITCSTTAKFFPRLHGACRAVYRVIDEVERFAISKGRGAQDVIGLVQFANYSYVISYPTNDYEGFRKRVDDMELYLAKILGTSTNMHLAIWDAYLMALERNMAKNSNFTYLSGQDIRSLAIALAPGEKSSRLTLPDGLREKLAAMRQELRDTTFIVITDALVNFLQGPLEHGSPYSIRRQMQLAEFLETPFFYLSTDEFYPELKRLARLTGHGEPDAASRGDFLMVKKEGDYAQMSELVSAVLKGRFSERVLVRATRRESYGQWCVLAALFFLFLSIGWKKSGARSLTDKE